VLTAVRASLAKGDFDQVPQLESVPKAKTAPFGKRWN